MDYLNEHNRIYGDVVLTEFDEEYTILQNHVLSILITDVDLLVTHERDVIFYHFFSDF